MKYRRKKASEITKTNVAITAVTVNPWNGSISIYGFKIGNPKGFQSENAIKFSSVYAKTNALSLFDDEIIINQLNLDNARINYEVGVRGDNIRKLIGNVKSKKKRSSSGSDSGKTFSIKDLNVTNSNLILAANLFDLEEDKEIDLSNIHLKDLNSTGGAIDCKTSLGSKC